MSHKGYAFESEIEDYFLKLTNQTKKDPILKANEKGLIQVNRSFRIPTSGAMESMKGDILTAIPWLPKQLKVECKTRREKNKKEGRIFTLELDWVRKNNDEAKADNQIPILTFAFKGDTSGMRTWWLIKVLDFAFLRNDLDDGEEWKQHYCSGIILNKKKDKLKVIHSAIKTMPLNSCWNVTIDSEPYLLMSHDQFNKTMVQIRAKNS